MERFHMYFLPDVPIVTPGEDILQIGRSVNLLEDAIYNARTPFVFGVLGDWGAGKTSALNLLQARLLNELSKDQRRVPGVYIPIWFDAWKYENEINMIYPLLDAVRRDYDDRVMLWNEAKGFGQKFVEIAVTSTLALTDVALRALTKKLIDDPMTLAEISEHLERVQEHSKNIEYTLREWVDQVGKLKGAFEDLLETYAKEYAVLRKNIKSEDVRFVFLIDDLDRCLPDTVITILENLKHHLAVESAIYVIALNPKVVYQGIRSKYKDVEVDGREYMEKIINYSFYLPRPKSECVIELTSKKIEELVGDTGLKQHLSTFFGILSNTFAECQFTNPRKIKRILNRYLHFIMEYEPNLDAYFLPDIARLIVLSEYFPSIFQTFLIDEHKAWSFRDIGTPEFSLSEIEQNFGTPLKTIYPQLAKMRRLFEFISTPEGTGKNSLGNHVQAVFSITQLY